MKKLISTGYNDFTFNLATFLLRLGMGLPDDTAWIRQTCSFRAVQKGLYELPWNGINYFPRPCGVF